MVDVVDIVEWVVEMKMQFGHDSKLVVYAFSQEVSDLSALFPDFSDQRLFVFAAEEAEINFGDGQVFRYHHFGYRDQRVFE